MRKTILTLVASAALAFGIAGQASARDYHDGGHRGGGYYQGHNDRQYDRGHDRHYDRGPDRHYDRGHGRHYDRGHSWHRGHARYRHQNHYRPHYSGYYQSPYVYGPPASYYGGYGYGVGYSQPGFGIYIGR